MQAIIYNISTIATIGSKNLIIASIVLTYVMIISVAILSLSRIHVVISNP